MESIPFPVVLNSHNIAIWTSKGSHVIVNSFKLHYYFNHNASADEDIPLDVRVKISGAPVFVINNGIRMIHSFVKGVHDSNRFVHLSVQ